MKKQNYYLQLLALLVFAVLVGFSFHSITNDDLNATSEGSSQPTTVEGGPILWDNSTVISPTTSGIISSRLRGISDTNDVTIADNFIVPPSETWQIDSIAIQGFNSLGTQVPDSFNFVIRTDNNGAPGAIIQSVNITGLISTTGITRIAGIFGTPLSVPAGKHWLEVVAVFDTNTVLATARWNWNYGTVANGGDTANIRSRAAYFGAPFDWVNVNTLVAADLSHWFIIYGSVSTPPTNETLVLLHDSTLGSSGNIAERKADRDALMSALPMLISDYDVMTFDTTTTLPGLSGYKTIIVQETSFDDTIVRYLGATARGQIVAWLNSGTSGDKKAFLSIAADNGWNYSRSGSPARDLVYSQTTLKFVYQADNSGGLAPSSITGVGIDIGNARLYSTAGSGFWPDGCSAETGADVLYHYTARGTDDSLAAIGYSGTGYVAATLNLDPRYFTGSSFKSTLENMIGYLVTNGGIITGTPTNITNTLPDNYSLSQNYPNPFNPSTKINFSIPQAGLVSIVVYDMLGREVQSLVNENLTAGSYIAEFNGAGLSSGTYFYRLQVGEFVQVKRMVLLK